MAAAAGVGDAGERGAARQPVGGAAVEVGRRLGVSEPDLAPLRRAAELHDVGLIGVPAGLLLRPSRLSHDEARILHEHPLIAERLVRPLARHRTTGRVLRHVHERYDGTGYRDGLAGGRTPPASPVLAP